MPNTPAPAARLALNALLAACLVAAPAAHADFRVNAKVGPLVFTAFDPLGNPLPPDSFSFDGSRNASGYYLSAAGATTTLPSANLWANYTSALVGWSIAGASTHLIGPDSGAGVVGGTAALGYDALIANQGMQLEVWGSGANRAAMGTTRAGSSLQGDGLLTLAPFVTLRLDLTLNYDLRQDGHCNGDVCDAAFVGVWITRFTGAPGTSEGGGLGGGFGIGPRPIVDAGYAWFLTDAMTNTATGTQTLTDYFVNDTDQPLTLDFYVSMTGAGSSVVAVPEPGSAALLGLGALAVLAAARRRRAAAA